MPELPEAQTTVNGINEVAKNLIITDVWTDYNSTHHIGKDTIKDPAYFLQFRKKVKGAMITHATRRAKNVLIHLSNPNPSKANGRDGHTILIHMKMTGHMMYGDYKKLPKKDSQGEWWRPTAKSGPLTDPFNRFIHLVFSLSNGKYLVLSDMRRFAKTTLLETHNMHNSKHLRKSGPEPLEKTFDEKAFRERLSLRPNAPIKLVLMNHEIVAGIGNIYSDEILWRSGLHPLEKVKNIPSKYFSLMFKAMRETLRKGIDFGGDSMSDYRNILGERGAFQDKHNAYQKHNTKCSKPGCKGKIVRLKIDGRSGHFCDTHQKLGFSY